MIDGRIVSISAALMLALGVTAVLSLAVGAVVIPPADVVQALLPGTEAARPSHNVIIWDLRLPRVLLSMVVGGGLAAAGAAFQGLFQNALAEPYVVGASSGAALGAVLVITGGVTLASAGFGPVGLGAFIGALLAVIIVYGVAEASGSGSVISLLLAGVAFSTMLSAVVSLVMILNTADLSQTFSWLLGGLGGRTWEQIGVTLLYTAPGVAVIWMMARPLDALACGDETAQSLGLNLRRARLLIVAAASLVTAAAVAVSGVIGFVGLMAPHITRALVGADHARVIPVSILVGALLLLVADTAARVVLAPVELPVGILTAMIGGPFFLYLLARGQAWRATT
ncbi:MAG: iron ABC transporter permease [Anaerolineae bacterium]|nr:iron ABC transporter permease [Anaerolineae bacterium]